MNLPEDKKDSSPLGSEIVPDSVKLEELMEKCCSPCLWTPFKTRAPHIALTKSEESGQ